MSQPMYLLLSRTTNCVPADPGTIPVYFDEGTPIVDANGNAVFDALGNQTYQAINCAMQATSDANLHVRGTTGCCTRMLKEHDTMCLIKTSTTPSSSPPIPTSLDGIR